MSEFRPYFTNDGSVGLYSEEYDDIYHSASGALTEAYEKFVYPVNWDNLLLHDNIRILDICYGIGYNTKSFLNFIFENQKKLLKRKKNLKKNLSNKTNIETIYTNNTLNINNGNYIDKLYTDNIFNKISVTAIDKNEILFGISPFIKTGVKNFKNDSDVIYKHNINKYLRNNKRQISKIENFINFLILSKISQNSAIFSANSFIDEILSDNRYAAYLNGKIKAVYKYLYRNIPSCSKLVNLHNIYYKYLSFCYKNKLKRYKIQDFIFNIKIEDARVTVKNDNNLYNLIFLDAFTPQKCPCLWSYDFFKELYRILDSDGMLLTYSSSATIRAAMSEAGFFIGNIYNKRLNKFQGTIAVKNKSLIKYQLSEYDFGLLKTRAGIFYRDPNLNAQNEAIIKLNEEEVKYSDRISSSQYIKSRSKNEI